MDTIRSSTAPNTVAPTPKVGTVRKKAYKSGQEFTDQVREIHEAEAETPPPPPGTGKMIDTSI